MNPTNKPFCEVIQDLLPLCRDDVCSDESRRLVKEHLESCADCRAVWDALEAEPPAPQGDPLRPLRAIRTRFRRRVVLISGGILLGLLALFAIGWIGYTQLVELPSGPLAVENADATIEQLFDGSLYVTVTCQNVREGAFSAAGQRKGGICYITPTGAWAERLGWFHGTGQSAFLYVPQTDWQEGHRSRLKGIFWQISSDMLNFTGLQSGTHEGVLDFTELRLGTPEAYKTIWKQGDAVPAASVELDAIYRYVLSLPEPPFPVEERGKTQ